MFDMIVGSETGAIIAASLVVPDASGSKVNKYNASRAVEFFETNVDKLYVDSKFSGGMQFLISFLFLIIFSFIAYKSAEVYFRDPKQDDRLKWLSQLLKLVKKLKKGKIQDDDIALKINMSKCEELMGEKSDCKDIKVQSLYFKVKKNAGGTNEDALELLIEDQTELAELNKGHLRR